MNSAQCLTDAALKDAEIRLRLADMLEADAERELAGELPIARESRVKMLRLNAQSLRTGVWANVGAVYHYLESEGK